MKLQIPIFKLKIENNWNLELGISLKIVN